MQLFSRTMKFCSPVFNIYLCLFGLFLGGCSTTADKNMSTLRLHAEASQRDTQVTSVPIFRKSPILMAISKDPVVTEHNVISARVVEELDGFIIEVKFDRQGTWLLERASVDNMGRHMAVFSEFGRARWLAAPVITTRITGGIYRFTPDASREEADRIVSGLNKLAATKTAYDRW